MELKAERQDNFTDYVVILWKRRTLVIWITLTFTLFSVVLVGVSKIAPPALNPLPQRYRAIALVQIRDLFDFRTFAGGKESSNYEYLAELAGVRTNIKVKNALITLLAKSNPVLAELSEKTISSLDIPNTDSSKGRLKGDFKRNIKVEPDESSRTISISYVSIYPDFSSLVVNTLIDLLNERMLTLEREDYHERLQEIKRKIDEFPESRISDAKRIKDESISPGNMPIPNGFGDYSEVMQKTIDQYDELLVSIAMLNEPLNIIESADTNIEFANGSSAKILIAGIAVGLFISTFIAFVVEYIDRIRADSDRMAKIRASLGAGKK